MCNTNNLIKISSYFNDKEVCKKHLENLRWTDGVITCPHCSHSEKIYRTNQGFKCSSCKKRFSVTKGTIFENSPISLHKWFVAIWLLGSNKKGISSNQLARDIGVTQKSAWYMLHRIRYVFENESFDKPLENIVEVDETYVGGLNKNRHWDKKVKRSQGRSTKDKTAVFGMLERGGKVRAMKVDSVSAKELQRIIVDNIEVHSTIMSDEWGAYTGLDKKYHHYVVNHGRGNYAKAGGIHTNSIESFWSLLKRSYKGTYHYMSPKHLDKYVKEFEFRYNNSDEIKEIGIDSILRKSNVRLTYKELTNKESKITCDPLF